MVASDRLSAFDVVMPKGIPYKGQILNQIATQISALEEVYKHQLSLVTLAENVEPKRNGWFSGHIKTREDRLANIMD